MLGTSGFLEIEGQEGTATGGYRLVTDDYFRTMDLHLLRGRDFTTADDSTHPHVTIVNQAMAEKYWKGQDPIGRRFRARSWDSHPDVWLTVIGVVNNIRYWTLEADPQPEHFVYFRQRPDRAAVHDPRRPHDGRALARKPPRCEARFARPTPMSPPTSPP